MVGGSCPLCSGYKMMAGNFSPWALSRMGLYNNSFDWEPCSDACPRRCCTCITRLGGMKMRLIKLERTHQKEELLLENVSGSKRDSFIWGTGFTVECCVIERVTELQRAKVWQSAARPAETETRWLTRYCSWIVCLKETMPSVRLLGRGPSHRVNWDRAYRVAWLQMPPTNQLI